jgi:hypothetical protein
MPVTIDGSNTPTAGGVGYGDGTELAFTNAGTAGQVLKSNGAGAPTWGSSTVNLATDVTGTLPVGNGGTGATTFTSNNVLLGNGASSFQTVAPGSSGNVLTSDGTTWQSTAPAGGGSLILVSTATGSSTTQVDLTSGLTSTYPVYKLYVNFTNSSSTDMVVQFYINSSLITSPSGYYRTSFLATAGGTWSNTNSSGNAAVIFANNSGRNNSWEFTIFSPTSTTRPPLYYISSSGNSTSSNGYAEQGMCGYDMSSTAGALTGFRFSFQGSSVATFAARLYGIKT